MKIKILYEDSNILAIDKPSGVSVHPAAEPARHRASAESGKKGKFITDWVVKNYPKMKNIGEPQFFENKGTRVEIKRSGVVHRLDRDTSGVLLLAKNQKTFLFLKNQFINREIKKNYAAIVSGFVKNDHGIINKPIGRSPKDFRRYSAGRGARGEMREAITEYKVLKRFQIRDKNYHEPTLGKFSFLEISPKTGRTHQIRAHMKFLNHPVVCDSLYNPEGICPKSLSRLALHARYIEFKNLQGKIIKVESNLPREFTKLINLAG